MFALSEDGDITMLDMDKNGWLDEAITACNFKRVEYR